MRKIMANFKSYKVYSSESILLAFNKKQQGKFYFVMIFHLMFFLNLTANAVPSGDFFPAVFQNNQYHICENFPGVLTFYAASNEKYNKGKLRIDIPDFLVLNSTCFVHNMKSNEKTGEKTIIQDTFSVEKITRSNLPYKRYHIELSKMMIKKITDKYQGHHQQLIYLTATPNSSEKKGIVYWEFMPDEETTQEQKFEIKVLPPLRMPNQTPKKFKLFVAYLYSTAGAADLIMKNNLYQFWKSLTQSEILTMGVAVNGGTPDPQFNAAIPSGSVGYMPNYRPDPFEDEMRTGKLNHQYPVLKTHSGYSLSPAYMITDPNGFFAKYLKDGIERFRKSYPYAKYIFWDIEPLITEQSSYDCNYFCENVLKIKTNLPYDEIVKHYQEEWKNYRFDQTTQIAKKVRTAISQHWPEIKLIICGAGLASKESDLRDSHCAVDMRNIDAYADIHMPMIYFQNLRFFDDLNASVSNVKNPVIPLIDPSEPRLAFYERYTPEGVLQNIIAAAALKSVGIGFWPYECYDGRYLQAIADGFAILGRVEDIYTGNDITDKCHIEPANVVKFKMLGSDGTDQEILLPELNSTIRYKVHQKGNHYAVSLFNYSKISVIFKINVPQFMEDILIEVKPMGVKVVTEIPEQKTVKAELERQITALKKNQEFNTIKSEETSITWRVLDHQPQPSLTAGNYTLVVDKNKGAVAGWVQKGSNRDIILQNSKKDRGVLGQIFIMENGAAKMPLDFVLKKFEIKNQCPSIIFEHIQLPYGGAAIAENFLEGLSIQQQWTLSASGQTAIMECTVSNKNTNGKALKTALKIQTYPRLGSRFGVFPKAGFIKLGEALINSESTGNVIYVRPKMESVMKHSNIRPPIEWENFGDVIMRADYKERFDELTITPDPIAITSFYNWWSYSDGYTAEFITKEYTLSPNEKETFKIIYNLNLK